MASKPSTSKPTNARTGSARKAETAPTGAPAKKRTSITDQKATALSLIDELPKRTRRKAATLKEPALEESKAELDKPVTETLAEKKANALSLFDEPEKKAERKRARQADEARTAELVTPASSNLLTPISKILAGQEEASKPKPPEPVIDESGEVEGEVEVLEVGDAKIVHFKGAIRVKDLADKMGLKVFHLIKDLISMDIFPSLDTTIEPDVAAKICELHGFVFEREKRREGGGIHKVIEEAVEPPAPPPATEKDNLEIRPPIVTIMGHVDHGKTTLLDYMRKTKVAAGEAGGITQHIGAYTVQHAGQTITFLDTPGHAAFSQMRARGADITDIVVLVIAADDGMMPTTFEALNHARAAKVRLVVAITKIDVPNADVNRVKSQLQQNELAPEDWGGDTSCVEVSAIKGTGVDSLLEIILLEAELLELKCDPKAPVRAIVVESRLEPGKGPTATVITQSGTLAPGMPFICGPHWGKIKSLLDEQGRSMQKAGPAIPAELIGFSGMPNVGDEVVELKSERDAKRLSEERLESLRLDKLALPRRSRMEDLFAGMEVAGKKLRLVVKGDVAGSVEAIVGALKEIKSDKVELEILHAAAGPVSESDVLLASASDAVVIGFNVKVEGKAVATAKHENVQIKLYSIIYELLDQIKDAMLGLLDPETREKILGHALVKQVFKVQRGFAAGCIVTDGRVARSAHARVLRDKQPVFDGKMSTLRRFTEDVNEVRNGIECGIRLGDFNEYEEGDVIECYELEKFAQTL
ncbi:MAG: translation initiation factor IF-2 [Verrucomicrobiales bacterium]